jgi:hypothetical protein
MSSCAARLEEPRGVLGTLRSGLELDALVERHRPRPE